MLKPSSKIEYEVKEYPELTFEQVEELVRLLKSGKTEEEALEMIRNG